MTDPGVVRPDGTAGLPAGAVPGPEVTAGRTMRAVVQDRYGAAPEDVLRLADIEPPTIGDDEVLVRVHAAGVARGTWHIMAGLPYPIRLAGFGLRRPKYANPGRSLAGTVQAVGSDVTGFAPGDEVYGIGTGAFAEYSAARAGKLALKPANLTFAEAAAVPVSGMTALQAVTAHGRIRAGHKVLITGASGGVGSFAVQIANARGAEVTGVASGGKADLVRGLGADHVLDYARDDFADGSPGYDVVLDIGGNASLARLRRALAPHGRLVIVGGETDGRLLGGSGRQIRATLQSPFVGQQLGTFLAAERAADLMTLRELIEAGVVTPVVDRTYPLDEVAAAIRRLQDGKARGTVVVSVCPAGPPEPRPGSTSSGVPSAPPAPPAPAG
jgi:NADPH:quinone reductase-like Zn-dependent oxidoreductase